MVLPISVIANEAALVSLAVTIPVTKLVWLSAQAYRRKKNIAEHGEGRAGPSAWAVLMLSADGGPRHLAFQFSAWALWIFACAGIATVFGSSGCKPGEPLPCVLPDSHHEAALGASVVCGILGEVLLLKSFLVFRSPDSSKGHHLLRGTAAAAASAVAVVLSGALLSILGLSLMTYFESLPDMPSRLAYTALAGACLLVAASSTHGLAGDLLHGGDGSDSWRFFQPGVGGSVFILTQAAGWLLFSLALLGILALARSLLQGAICCMETYIHGTGFIMVVGQLVLGGSLFAFQGGKTKDPSAATAAATAAATSQQTRRRQCGLQGHIIVASLFLPVHLFCSVVAVSFAVLPTQTAVAVWVAALIPYYCLTSWGEPAHTGHREWESYRAWTSRNIQEALEWWLGGLSVVRVSERAMPPEKRYVFGYHPHALYPTGAAYLSAVPSFKELLPGIQPKTLVASMLFLAPVLRDLASWAGIRKVSKRTFVNTLREERAVMVCPGGQAELCHAYRIRSPKKEVVINCRHRGFIRLALTEGAALVPVLVFGELLSLRNAFDWPALQKWTYKVLGFPIPYLIVGRWFTPLPREHPVGFVIGDPLERSLDKEGKEVTDEEIEEMHKKYFGALVEMFEKNKDKHEGYSDASLVLSNA